jgi:hypothetical protein
MATKKNKKDKMVFPPKEVILDRFKLIYPPESHKDKDLDIKVDDISEKQIVVKISRMYNYVDTSFKKLKEISEAFGTDEIDLNQWSMKGCDTCDFGSSYEVTFTITNYQTLILMLKDS